jgi:site-specific DNA recombinase
LDCADMGSEGKARGRKRQAGSKATTLTIAWKKTPSKKPRELIPPTSTTSRSDPRPIRAETRTKLIAAIAKGRQWLDELVTCNVTNAEQIAAREACTIRQVNMTISLAFLGPALVNAAIEGRLPRGVGVANLRDAPLLWSKQRAMLGLAPGA